MTALARRIFEHIGRRRTASTPRMIHRYLVERDGKVSYITFLGAYYEA